MLRSACRVFSTLVTLSTMLVGAGWAQHPSDLKILYVGSNPDTATIDRRYAAVELNTDRLLEFERARTPSFERFLEQHFEQVDVVYVDDFQEQLSDSYDVTIFGSELIPIEKRSRTKDADGNWVVKRAKYLSEDYDNAAILIGVVSPQVAEPLEYKMDWMCLCLDAHAHDVKEDHAIFNEPNKVNLSFVSRDTPTNYKKYFLGRDLPDEMPMWRVQTEGYMEGKGFPVGMVSSAWGFDDAPDAEIISFGVNTKPQEAVALGRHGNFFHWGFAAAPDEMTEEAKTVFVNAIHYIANFNGEKPYSRRTFRTQTREIALDTAHRASDVDQQYVIYVEMITRLFEEDKRLVEAKKAQGKSLSFADRRLLSKESADIPTKEEYVENRVLGRMPATVVELFGDDLPAYLGYYQNNLEFLKRAEKPYQYEVDEEVASLGVSNRGTALLDAAIKALEQNPEAQLARSVLLRYTTEQFSTAQEWRSWYESNKDQFYFAEVDGFVFRIVPRTE